MSLIIRPARSSNRKKIAIENANRIPVKFHFIDKNRIIAPAKNINIARDRLMINSSFFIDIFLFVVVKIRNKTIQLLL